jgi:hypothetical protein
LRLEKGNDIKTLLQKINGIKNGLPTVIMIANNGEWLHSEKGKHHFG